MIGLSLAFWTGVFVGAILTAHLIAPAGSNGWTDLRVNQRAIVTN